jgi:ferredoxin
MIKIVKVNKQVCIGCGLCAVINPSVFKMGKDGKSTTIKEVSVLDKKTKEAMNSCPVKAIMFEKK